MPKQKVRKSALKRFRITKTGKVMRRLAFGRHLRGSKSARQKRRYAKQVAVTGPVKKRVLRLIAKA